MKTLILQILKMIGFFTLSKFLVRKKLLILAYHAIEIEDETSFSPSLYIKLSTFQRRMEYLKKNGFNVLELKEALKRLGKDGLPPNSVVITFDDGWYSTLRIHNVLADNSFPYTIYLTSYYANKKVPVLNIVLRYLIWLRPDQQISFDHFNSLKTSDKLCMINRLASAFGIDYSKIAKSRRFSLLSNKELAKLSENGVDIQLHTHKHTMENLEDGINKNILFLQSCVSSDIKHFCYPSGKYHIDDEGILRKAKIESATTCEPGFVTKKTNPYYLPRFLDSEGIDQIIFEAELCGVMNFFRKIRKRVAHG